MELLLLCGASVDQRSYSGHTPLYCALYRPNTRMRELLRKAGASDVHDDDDDDDDEEDEKQSDEVRQEAAHHFKYIWCINILWVCPVKGFF